MSSVSIRLRIQEMRANLRRIRERLPALVALELKRIAELSVEERYGDVKDAAQADRGLVYGRLGKLGAVFVPVTLKHVREEQWPDLQPIYDARIRRKQATYQGRRRFWVDEVKLDALRRAQLARRFRKLSDGEWKVSLKADYGDVKVTIRKNGTVSRSDKKAAAEIVAIMESMFAERASAILYQAMRE